MKRWYVNLTVLSESQLDMFKLALLDIGPVKSGYANGVYVVSSSKYLGVAMSAIVEVEGELDDVRLRVINALEKRGVQYITIYMRFYSTDTPIPSFFACGNIPVEHTSDGPYRTKGSVNA